jgi:hypothetical protein
MPAQYVHAQGKRQKNDFCDAEAVAEAVQRPMIKSVARRLISSTWKRCTGCANESEICPVRRGLEALDRGEAVHLFKLAPETRGAIPSSRACASAAGMTSKTQAIMGSFSHSLGIKELGRGRREGCPAGLEKHQVGCLRDFYGR